jgi:MFS transporter, DHA1 family, multidrug resistance protein
VTVGRRIYRSATAGLDSQVVLLSLTTCVVMLGASVITPVLPLYARQFGVSYAGAGLMMSAFAAGRLVFDYAGGRLADRTSPRLLATIGALVTAVSALASGLAESFAWLVVYRVLEGVGSALYVITIMALFARTVPPARMGKAMGFYQSQILLGVTFGPTLGGVVAELWGMRAPFFVMAAIGLVVAAITYAGVSPEVPRASGEGHERPSTAKLLRHVTSRPFLFVLALTFLVFGLRAGLRTNLIPLFGGELGGLGETAIGIVLSASAFTNFVVLWHAGSLLDRRGRLRVALPALLVAALSSAAFAISPSFPNLLLASLVLGAAFGYLAPAPAAMAADLTPPAMMGGMIGIYRMGGDLGLLVGPVTLGLVAERYGFEVAFVASGALALAVLGLGLRLPETLGREHAPAPIDGIDLEKTRG